MHKLFLVAALLFSTATYAGNASWYNLPGHRTASGQMYSSSKLTAAHRTLKFGTKVLVTNVHNHKSVIVVINDRGPFIKGRVIDLSKAAAGRIGMIGSGTAHVSIKVLK